MNSPTVWARVKIVFDAARQLASEERASYLDEACAGDLELRREVESLLASFEAAGSFIEASARLPAALAGDPLIGSRLGAWRVVAEIGVGGMGAVYRAVRDDDQFHKDVAVKVLPGGASGDAATARLRSERQILARLEHPNIARLLDGGNAPDGRPYLVMELVDGEPIDRFCEHRGLVTRVRLELFAKVCDAVQYAHQNLVVHRDLKPGNILVTPEGVPKLLDFGIAKLLEADTEAVPTITEMRALTPRYASPEQISGEPVTTASDVYSLGVLLYELLTGRPPYELRTQAPEELLLAVCRQEPERPSRAARRPRTDRVRAAATDGRTTSSARELRGDLDWITLTALRKEPARRYASARDLGEDIRRHLAGLPVQARPDTLRYRTSKFVRRHRVGVAAAALLLLSLAAGFAVSLWQWKRAEAAHREAEQRLTDTRRLTGTLLFELHDAIQKLPGATAARELVVRRGVEYLDRLAASSPDDDVKAELAVGYLRLGEVQGGGNANLGDSAGAMESYRKAVRLAEAAGADPQAPLGRREVLARSYRELASARRGAGERKEADQLLARAVAILEEAAVRQPGDPRLKRSLAAARFDEGQARVDAADWEGAVSAYGRCAQLFEELARMEPEAQERQRNVALAHKYMGGALQRLRRLTEARRHHEQAVAIDRRLLALDEHNHEARMDLSFDLASLAKLDGLEGKLESAVVGMREVLALREAVLKADPVNVQARAAVARAHGDLADYLALVGERPAAERQARRALLERERLAAGSLASLHSSVALAHALLALGDTISTGQPHPEVVSAASLRGPRATEACALYRRGWLTLAPHTARLTGDGRKWSETLARRLTACGERAE